MFPIKVLIPHLHTSQGSPSIHTPLKHGEESQAPSSMWQTGYVIWSQLPLLPVLCLPPLPSASHSGHTGLLFLPPAFSYPLSLDVSSLILPLCILSYFIFSTTCMFIFYSVTKWLSVCLFHLLSRLCVMGSFGPISHGTLLPGTNWPIAGAQ